MEGRDKVTATSFRVMVSEAEPYSFQSCASQQVQSSVRITHITFTPPDVEEVKSYMQHQQKLASAMPAGTSGTVLRLGTHAGLRTLCASGKMESHSLVCFPWAIPDEVTEAMVNGSRKKKMKKRGSQRHEVAVGNCSKAAAAQPMECVQLAGVFNVALPRHTDICSNVDIRFDVDGSVWLEVVGPGSVTFFGEQYSSLIPEWLNHHFFTVGEDDEEEEDDEDDIAEMYRLIH